jgi:DNA processing protein
VENESLITLGNLPLVGPILAKTLLSYCGSPSAVLNEKKHTLKKIPGVSDAIADSVTQRIDDRAVQREITFIEKHNIRMLPYFHEDYPKRLKQLLDSPLYIFAKGNMNLNAPRMAAVIGSRKNTQYGKEMTDQIVEGLAKYNVNIVSGLAYGVDGIAHKKANECKMPNIGVLAHGLDTIYPSMHIPIAKEILKTGGALVTEHITQTKMHQALFPKRNRIVAGLCDICIVVESQDTGGSMITVAISEKYKRHIFAIPGRQGDKMSTGCNNLIKSRRAHLVTCADDIAEVMSWNKVQGHQKQMEIFTELSQEETIIIDLLHQKKMTYDELLILSQLPMSRLTTILLEMEMNGIIHGLPGKVYGIAVRT